MQVEHVERPIDNYVQVSSGSSHSDSLGGLCGLQGHSKLCSRFKMNSSSYLLVPESPQMIGLLNSTLF